MASLEYQNRGILAKISVLSSALHTASSLLLASRSSCVRFCAEIVDLPSYRCIVFLMLLRWCFFAFKLNKKPQVLGWRFSYIMSNVRW